MKEVKKCNERVCNTSQTGRQKIFCHFKIKDPSAAKQNVHNVRTPRRISIASPLVERDISDSNLKLREQGPRITYIKQALEILLAKRKLATDRLSPEIKNLTGTPQQILTRDLSLPFLGAAYCNNQTLAPKKKQKPF